MRTQSIRRQFLMALDQKAEQVRQSLRTILFPEAMDLWNRWEQLDESIQLKRDRLNLKIDSWSEECGLPLPWFRFVTDVTIWSWCQDQWFVDQIVPLWKKMEDVNRKEISEWLKSPDFPTPIEKSSIVSKVCHNIDHGIMRHRSPTIDLISSRKESTVRIDELANQDQLQFDWIFPTSEKDLADIQPTANVFEFKAIGWNQLGTESESEFKSRVKSEFECQLKKHIKQARSQASVINASPNTAEIEFEHLCWMVEFQVLSKPYSTIAENMINEPSTSYSYKNIKKWIDKVAPYLADGVIDWPRKSNAGRPRMQ